MLALATAAVLASDRLRSAAQQQYAATQTYEDFYYLPPKDYLVLGALGYRASLADLIWLKTLVYYGEELGHRGNVKHLYQYADAMLALDPEFKKVYRWVASSAIYRTGTVTVADAQAAIRYLERGTRRFPDDGELAWDLGANYTYELAPMLATTQEREAARRKGLDYLEAAVLRGAGPPWLVLQTAGELRALGRNEQAIRHLEEAYAVSSDVHVKEQIELQLTRLRSATYAEAFRRSNEELETDRLRDFPYLETTLYLLVGPRPAFGGEAWLLRGFDPATARSHQGLSD
jgi:tetratricopeptide (TPR) repeat protein